MMWSALCLPLDVHSREGYDERPVQVAQDFTIKKCLPTSAVEGEGVSLLLLGKTPLARILSTKTLTAKCCPKNNRSERAT